MSGNAHPRYTWTLCYIAFVVTLLLVLAVIGA